MVTNVQDRERYAATIRDAYALASEALGHVQATQTDSALYELLLDLNQHLADAYGDTDDLDQCIELGCTAIARPDDAYCMPHGDAVARLEQRPFGGWTPVRQANNRTWRRQMVRQASACLIAALRGGPKYVR